MSQQINLLLAELRPKFDWLALPVVLGVALAGLVGFALVVQGQAMQLDGVKAKEREVAAQASGLQQQLISLGQALSQRQTDASLPQQIAAAKAGVVDRQEVLAFVGLGDKSGPPAFSRMLEGFSRQSVDGAWLVGFVLASDAIEIRGRLLDPALLPVYINRLNSDLVFVGRRFAALEMKGVDPVAEKPVGDKLDTKPAATGRYTEFSLRTESVPVPEKTP